MPAAAAFDLSRLFDVWRARSQGRLDDSPDWIGPEALHWLGWRPEAPDELIVGLRRGVPARALPRVLVGPDGERLRLRCVDGRPARAQAVPSVARPGAGALVGTATCLARDRLSPDRLYVLSCGHVLAPDATARYGDVLDIVAGASTVRGALREWQPAVAPAGTPAADIDAGLAEVDASAADALRGQQDWLPAAISDATPLDRQVRIRQRGGDLLGSIKLHWAGQIDLPEGHAGSYALRDAVGCATEAPTEPGDSGAPLWTRDDALLGLHVASIDPEAAAGANALFCRIAPVLDWYQIKAFTRGDPATVEPVAPRGGGLRLGAVPAGGVLNTPADETLIVAKTLWGEARGEGPAGMKAVANVIVNRLAGHYRGCDTATEVCLDPKQFSCWNTGDPNRARLAALGPGAPDAAFATALDIAAAALRGGLPDATFGARHYVHRHLRPRPSWLFGHVPCVVIGNHEFYNTVA